LYKDITKEIETVQKTFEGEAKINNTLLVTFKDKKVWNVPHDPANTDYQAIQEWVAEGNTIAEAD
jgi:hypothetical protein